MSVDHWIPLLMKKLSDGFFNQMTYEECVAALAALDDLTDKELDFLANQGKEKYDNFARQEGLRRNLRVSKEWLNLIWPDIPMHPNAKITGESTYIRAGIIQDLSEVLEHISETKEFFGQRIHLHSKRYRCFQHHGIQCVCCGKEGHFFAVEKHRYQHSIPYHLNLYHLNEFGQELLMTIDHIHPRSLGGGNTVDNLQTMCHPCNNLKGAMLPNEWEQLVLTKRDQ